MVWTDIWLIVDCAFMYFFTLTPFHTIKSEVQGGSIGERWDGRIGSIYILIEREGEGGVRRHVILHYIVFCYISFYYSLTLNNFTVIEREGEGEDMLHYITFYFVTIHFVILLHYIILRS